MNKTYTLSEQSKKNRDSCHPSLQIIINKAIKITYNDFGISYGHRSPSLQKELYKKGREYDEKNKTWHVVNKSEIVTNCDGSIYKSPHNENPSHAFDVVLYDGNGNITYDTKYYILFAGLVLGIAKDLYINIKWGGDFNKDGNILEEKTFLDLGHFELI